MTIHKFVSYFDLGIILFRCTASEAAAASLESELLDLRNSSREAAARVDSVEGELRIEQECRQQMQEASSTDRERLEKARKELAAMKKIKQVG